MSNIEVPSLVDLSQKYLSKKCKYEVPDSPIRGRSGHKWHFDAILKYNEKQFGVFIRAWDRSIGVNQVRQLHKACQDTNCAGGILIGNRFSPNAEMFAENVGINLLDRIYLQRKLRSQGYI